MKMGGVPNRTEPDKQEWRNLMVIDTIHSIVHFTQSFVHVTHSIYTHSIVHEVL